MAAPAYPRFEQPKKLEDGTFRIRVWRAQQDFEDIIQPDLPSARAALAGLQRAAALLRPRDAGPVGPDRGGCKSLLTPELHDAILAKVRKHMKPVRAAVACGIGERTFWRWMKDGEAAADEQDPRWQLWQDIAMVRAQAQEPLLATIERAAEMDYHAALLLLERVHGDDWSRAGGGVASGDSITVTFNRPELDPNEKGDDLVVVTPDEATQGKPGNGG